MITRRCLKVWSKRHRDRVPGRPVQLAFILPGVRVPKAAPLLLPAQRKDPGSAKEHTLHDAVVTPQRWHWLAGQPAARHVSPHLVDPAQTRLERTEPSHRRGRRRDRRSGRCGVPARAELDTMVYQQAPELGEVGAGLVVTPNTARLLRRLASAVALKQVGVVLETGWEFRRWADGTVLFAQQLGENCARRYGEHTWTLHRADLLEVRSSIPDEAIEFGRGCTGMEQDEDGVTLSFESGGPVRADVVVGADGIHSVLRERRRRRRTGRRGRAGRLSRRRACRPALIQPHRRS